VKQYAIQPGSTLVFSADGGVWETITFRKHDFADPDNATPAEVADVVDRADHLVAEVGADGNVVVATAAEGANVTLEFDLSRSTAGGALGLTPTTATARGAGLAAPRLTSMAREPFVIPLGAEMTVRRNRTRRIVRFDGGFTPGAALASDVVTILNQKLRGLARVGRDRRVMLRGNSSGPDGCCAAVAPSSWR
jgi:hypothetical protein